MQLICGDTPNCTDVKSLTQCMAATYVWNIQEDGVYLPYCWTDEYYDLKKSDALAIQSDVLDNQQLAHQVNIQRSVE